MKLNKRFFALIISILMVLLIPLIIYGFNINSVVFDRNLYKEEFLKYNVYNNLKEHDVEEINDDVLDYLQSEINNELIKNDFFNEREKTHFLDVKNLIQAILNIYYFSIILFVLLIIILFILLNFNFKEIAKRFLIILMIGSFLTLLDAVLFFLLSNFNFNFVFDFFHKTFFSAGTYTFNPKLENIVVLYPENLFFDFLIKIVANTILSSVITLFFSVILIFVFFRQNFLNFLRKFPSRK